MRSQLVVPVVHAMAGTAEAMTLVLGACLSLVGASPAWAQYAKADPLFLPEFAQVDPQGVDLASGIIETSLLGVSIGGTNHALKYELKSKGGYLFTNNLNMNDNWSIFLVTGVSCTKTGTPDTSCTTLDLPDRSATFRGSGSNYTRYYGCCITAEIPDHLVQSGSSYIYTSREGDVYTFTTSVPYNGASNVLHNAFYSKGRVYLLDSVRRADGETISIYYKSSGYYVRKQAVVSSLGYMLKYLYGAPVTSVGNGSNYAAITPSSVMAINLAWDYCDPAADSCALTYSWPTTSLTYGSATSVLATSTDTGAITIATDANYLPTTVTDPSTTRSIGYASSVSYRSATGYSSPINNVTTVTENGRSWTYSLNSVQGGQTLTRTNTMTATDPLGGAASMTTYYYATYTQMFWTPPGKQASQVKTYSFAGVETSFSDFEGNGLSFTVDGRGNRLNVTRQPKGQSGLNPVQTANDFDSSCSQPAKCNQPNWSTNGNGGRSDYEYDAATGLPTRITGPADGSGIRPVTRRYYAQRYAWLKNAQGGFGTGNGPLTVLAQEKTCIATATVGDGCAGGTADEVTTSYDYGPDVGPNNLLVRGIAIAAAGQVRRTCKSYDRQGNAVSTTLASALLGSCP